MADERQPDLDDEPNPAERAAAAEAAGVHAPSSREVEALSVAVEPSQDLRATAESLLSEAEGEAEPEDEGDDDAEAVPPVTKLVPADLAAASVLEEDELFEEPEEEDELPPAPATRIESAKEFFSTEIVYRLDIMPPEKRAALGGTYRVEVKGYRGGVWTMRLGPEFNVVNRREDAEVVITLHQRDFLLLVNGVLNPQLAILADKMRISGDVGKAVLFQDVLSPLAEKRAVGSMVAR